MTKRIVVISDTHIPLQDEIALGQVIRFIHETEPDEVVHIGDLMDYPQPSRWNKDTVNEFRGSVFEDSKAGKVFLGQLRDGYDGPIGVIEGNHDERPRTYLAKYAPALAESDAFELENLLDFGQFDVTQLPPFYEIAPGWVATHGHHQDISRNAIAGRSASTAANGFHKSVVMGHSHRLGLIPETFGYGGYHVTYTGMEVGHLTEMSKHSYLEGGTANWQQGFGILTVDGDHVQATPVSVDNGRFCVDGKMYYG